MLDGSRRMKNNQITKKNIKKKQVLMMAKNTGRFTTKQIRSPSCKKSSCQNAAFNSKSNARGRIF